MCCFQLEITIKRMFYFLGIQLRMVFQRIQFLIHYAQLWGMRGDCDKKKVAWCEFEPMSTYHLCMFFLVSRVLV